MNPLRWAKRRVRIRITGYTGPVGLSAKVRAEGLLPFLYSFPRAVSPRGRVRVYCIGAPRSGTHSVAGLLSNAGRVAHEPEPTRTILHLLRWLEGRYSDRRMRRLLAHRDQHLGLHLEAAHYLHHLAPLLQRTFPDARFIATVRDPQSWLESEINKNLAGTKSAIWRALEAYRYGRYDLGFTEWDAPLATVKNVYPVESYLRYWRDHYDLILKTISLDRLLFVNTHDIETRAREIAEFAQLPPSAVDRSAAHAGIGRRPIRLADTIDPAYVCRVVDDWCGNTYAKLSALAER